MIQRGIDVVIKIGGKPIAGQQNATLNRSMAPIDITNKINGSWNESLAGVRSWRVNCGGLYVLDAESLKNLEKAFMNNEELEVGLSVGEKNYFGRVLITDFPLSSNYNDQFKYRLTLLGDGPLQYENN